MGICKLDWSHPGIMRSSIVGRSSVRFCCDHFLESRWSSVLLIISERTVGVSRGTNLKLEKGVNGVFKLRLVGAARIHGKIVVN